MDFKLIINDRELDLNDSFAVQLSYEVEDTDSPSAVMTEYSKSITIPRTGNNDLAFNFIYDLDRVQSSEEGYYTPLERMPMTLHYKGNEVLNGYAKLESVTNDSYTVTLYSGIADFFYSFSTDSEGDTYTLDKLEFESTLDYKITKENVQEAWNRLNTTLKTGTSKWDTINFAPMYNGTSDNIDCNKALINLSGSSVFTASTYTEGSSAYTTYENSGLVLADLANECSEWEVLDLRSYNQRPVLSVTKFFEAVQRSAIKQGFNLNLDQGFFNNANPYYNKAWISMPLLSQLEVSGETYTGTADYTPTIQFKTKVLNKTGIPFSGQLSGAVVEMPSVNGKSNLSIKFRLSANVGYNGGDLYTGYMLHQLTKFQWENAQQYYGGENVPQVWCNSGTTVQFYLTDYRTGTIFCSSPTYTLSSLVDGKCKTYPSDIGYGTTEQAIAGTYKYRDGRYRFTLQGGSEDIEAVIEDIPRVSQMVLTMVIYSRNKGLYPKQEYWLDTEYSGESIKNLQGEVTTGDLSFTAFEKAGTNALITERMMFANMESVADYLISYSKTFGLKWFQEGNNITLMTRNRYYSGDVTDYTSDSDRSNLKLEPITFSHRYYDLKAEVSDSSLKEKYKNDWGIEDYGRQRIDTGYKFDSDTQEFFENNLYKGGIYGKMKSNYYRHIKGYDWAENNLQWETAPILDKTSYSLVRNGNDPDDTHQIDCHMDTIRYINYSEVARYDCNPRVCNEDSDKGAVDGENMLLFFDGFKPQKDANGYSIDYMLTDDLDDMFALNGDNATWLITTSEKDASGRNIAIKYNSLPDFSRYYTDNTNTIVYSMDYGEPKELYNDLSSNSSTTIYNRFWRAYLTDQMNVDTRKITLPLLYRVGFNNQTLRNFVRIDNQTYMINSVDYNVGETGTTSTELIKVNDVYNYTQGQQLIYPQPDYQIGGSGEYEIGSEGGRITINFDMMYMEDMKIESNTDWITGEIDNGKMIITVEANVAGAVRTGWFWIGGKDLGGNPVATETLLITQG